MTDHPSRQSVQDAARASNFLPCPLPPPSDPAAARSYLRAVRDLRGLTLRRLEVLCGYCNGYLSQIENGSRTPDSDCILAICGALRVDAAPVLCAFRVAPAWALGFWEPSRLREALAIVGGAS